MQEVQLMSRLLDGTAGRTVPKVVALILEKSLFSSSWQKELVDKGICFCSRPSLSIFSRKMGTKVLLFVLVESYAQTAVF